MTDTNLLTDKQFLTQFENQTLDPVHFNHQGHLRLAWLYLNQYPLPQAIDKVCTGIKAYAQSLGANDKFNLTVTDAIVKIMAQRLDQQPTKDWQTFIANNQDIKQDTIGVLNQYYSTELMFSDLAKTQVLKPDIQTI